MSRKRDDWYDEVVVDRVVNHEDPGRTPTVAERYEIFRRIGHKSNTELARWLGVDVYTINKWRYYFVNRQHGTPTHRQERRCYTADSYLD